MGTQRSHFAYRLAWTNTSTERIPFLPLHLRDLVLAEEGNRTYLDEGNTRINWKKFELMGEVVVGVQRSQGMPYPCTARNEEVQRLLLDGKFPKDDDVSRSQIPVRRFQDQCGPTTHRFHVLEFVVTMYS